jgi:hypothetical protein
MGHYLKVSHHCHVCDRWLKVIFYTEFVGMSVIYYNPCSTCLATVVRYSSPSHQNMNIVFLHVTLELLLLHRLVFLPCFFDRLQ